MSLFGNGISYSAQVVSANDSPATGTITVYDKGRAIAAGTLVDGKVRIALPRLSWGLHSLTAIYSGDSTHKASTTRGSSLVLVLL